MAQINAGKVIMCVPPGTLKKIKALNALGVKRLDIPYSHDQRIETVTNDCLGENYVVSYDIDHMNLATTLRWRELSSEEIKANRWNMMMKNSQESEEYYQGVKALRASHRDDVADAIPHSIIRSIPKVKPDGN